LPSIVALVVPLLDCANCGRRSLSISSNSVGVPVSLVLTFLWRQNLFVFGYHLHADSLFVIYFYPEDWDDIYFRNVCCLSSDYTVLYLTN
jgi:hypothetical protein